MPDHRVEKVTTQGMDWLKRNIGMVAVAGGLVVIIAVVLIYGEMSRQKDEEQAVLLYSNLPSSGEQRLQVLATLVNNYSGTSVGTRAKLDYAKVLYEGKRTSEAETVFNTVLAECGEKNPYGQRAKLGLAYCAQERGDHEKARKLYEEIKSGDGVYAPEAGRMLKMLVNPPAIPSGLLGPSGTVPIVPSGQVPEVPTEPAPKSSGNE